jgi:UDP-glucose-4-epimerase GalE
MNILVTGGAGYIGSHTCYELSQRGFTPIVYDSLERGFKDFVKWGPFVQGNLLDKAKLRELFSKYKIEAVIHFAAYAYVQESQEKPEIYFQNNVGGVASLISVMQEFEVNKIIFSSTCSVYGNACSDKINENQKLDPLNVYAMTKLIAEKVIQQSERTTNLKSIILRYFNAAGACPDQKIGEKHDPETRLIPLVIDSVENSSYELKVFGVDYPTEDGTAIRDYIHVNDLADAHVRALKYLIQNQKSDVFNLGTGKGHSVMEIIKVVEEVTGRKSKFKVFPRREGDPAVLVSNSEKANQVLNWKARYDIKSTVADAYKWYGIKQHSC